MRTSRLDKIARIYWLLEDCKRYGTLPFAGLARAAFIAVQFLRSLVAVGVLDRVEMAAFLGTLDTVSSQMTRDYQRLQPSAFLETYGHLRLETYDITSPRYDEAPDQYFEWTAVQEEESGDGRKEFLLSLSQLDRLEHLLRQHGLDHSVLSLFRFLKRAIEGREQAKFMFTRSLSLALTLIRDLGAEHGLSADDCSYLDNAAIKDLYSSCADIGEILRRSIDRGRERFERTQQILLPPLLARPEDVYSFHLPPSDPNFITLKKVAAPVAILDADRYALTSSIVFIPSADPGYDWIFSHRIGGLVTMYGGANSHMAIRASELGIPAVIGAGKQLYERWAAAMILELDCGNRQVRILRTRTAPDARSAAA